MITFLLIILLALIDYQPGIRAAYHVSILLTAGLMYQLPLPVNRLRQVAYWLAVPALAVIILAPWDNGNTMAMWIWATFYFCITPEITLPNAIIAYMTVWAMATTHSEGGWLALIAGAATVKWGWRGLLATFGAEVALSVSRFSFAGSLPTVTPLDDIGFTGGGGRVELLRHALDGFLSQPMGNGLGQYELWITENNGFWHAHNLVADVGYMLGVGGLLILGWVLVACWRANKPAWATAFLGAFLIHSMVDGPIWYIWPLLILTLKEVDFAGDTYYRNFVERVLRAYRGGHRPGPADTATPPLGVDARPVDTAGTGGAG